MVKNRRTKLRYSLCQILLKFKRDIYHLYLIDIALEKNDFFLFILRKSVICVIFFI